MKKIERKTTPMTFVIIAVMKRIAFSDSFQCDVTVSRFQQINKFLYIDSISIINGISKSTIFSNVCVDCWEIICSLYSEQMHRLFEWGDQICIAIHD